MKRDSISVPDEDTTFSYAEAIAYLVGRERVGIKFGLENIGRLMAALGHPERTFRSILVAGTNGKGSTVALLESILRASGFVTARYTSPHLVRLEERMMARGRLIREDELAAIVRRVKELSARLRKEGEILTEPTFFEVTTACAIEFFRAAGVEVAVLEVGMGGRWDATNIVPAALALITNVGMDHERYLGSTLASIAAEKAAIIKPGQPVLTGSVSDEALSVIRAEAERVGSPLHETTREVRIEAEELDGGQRIRLIETPLASYQDIFLPLAGEHQKENLALAVRAAEIARQVGIEVHSGAIATGVGATSWPARLERIEGTPALILDAAHNPDGAQALARYLASHPKPSGGRVLLFAVMKDKKFDAILEPLLPHVDFVIVTRPPIWRARNPESVAQWIQERGWQAEAVVSPKSALERARALSGGGEVLVAGSLFLAGEVTRLVERERVAREARPLEAGVG